MLPTFFALASAGGNSRPALTPLTKGKTASHVKVPQERATAIPLAGRA